MRLTLAFENGLGTAANTVVFHADPGLPLNGLGQVTAVHPNKIAHDAWGSRAAVQPEYTGGAAALAYVQATRSKAQTYDLIAQAAATAPVVVVDGQKTDGIDSFYKTLRKRVEVKGTVTKAHGRLFWFQTTDLTDLRAAPKTVAGLSTRAGVFSAEKLDSASTGLLAALPDGLPPRVADFGAGWGYLSADLIGRAAVKSLDLVEVDHIALTCARENITDPRARFHWQSVLDHQGTYDAIIMNPPFHQGREGLPELGQGFIQAAARCLTPKGQLWMVANQHLPYEATLAACFAQVSTLPAPKGFKIFQASRPKR